MNDRAGSRQDTRERIVDSAARLLREGGPDAVTTRGVAEDAGVQAPTIYRLFGDKDGLLEAVAEHVMAGFVSTKAAAVATAGAEDLDPLGDLRTGWHQQIAFGLANPTLFRLLSDPERSVQSPAARSGREVLEARVHRVAVTGRLGVGERRAADLLQSAGIGTIQLLLSTLAEDRDPGLADAMYELVLASILVDAPRRSSDPTLATAVAFRAVAPTLDAFTEAERQLLSEWLDRAVDALGDR